jgi:NAD(P)-dependent dehydrogenase (short-subunit alcohol dehydrogenase family)
VAIVPRAAAEHSTDRHGDFLAQRRGNDYPFEATLPTHTVVWSRMARRKSIVITGASSGFGAAFANALAIDGHDLFICARRADRLAEIATKHPTMFHVACDVSQERQVEDFFRRVGERTRSLDAVIHCAGMIGPLGTFDSVKSEEWIAGVTANLIGVYLVAKHALQLLLPEKRPRILVLSGGGAFDPMPYVSAYGASKAATVRLVETLAVELKPRNIAVNAVAPGFAPTEIYTTTLAAGRERAGDHFDKTVEMMANWDNSMDVPVDCIRYMLSDTAAKLSGKTISARYDPWGEPEFDEHIDEIMASPLYSTRRTIAEHLSASPLARALTAAAERKRNRLTRKFAISNQTVLTK